jgi:hypothetical protein
MMPDTNAANRIRALMGQSQDPLVQPTPDIEVGPMIEFDQPDGGFEFDRHFEKPDAFIKATSGPEAGNLVPNPDFHLDPVDLGPSEKPMTPYEQHKAFLRQRYQQNKQNLRDRYSSVMQDRRARYS